MFILNRYEGIAWVIYQDEKGRIIIQLLEQGTPSLTLWCADKYVFKSFTETAVAALGELFPELSWDAKLSQEILNIMDD